MNTLGKLIDFLALMVLLIPCVFWLVLGWISFHMVKGESVIFNPTGLFVIWFLTIIAVLRLFCKVIQNWEK